MPSNDAPKADVKDFLIKQLEKSGFTLERYVVNTLASDWSVTPNGHFHDLDLNKDREIDVLAEKEVYLEDKSILLTFYLVIECKKIPDKAWIFFPGPTEKGVQFIKTPEVLTLLEHFKIDFEIIPAALWNMSIKTGFFSSGFSEVFVPGSADEDNKPLKDKTDNIFEALTKVSKASESMRDIFIKSESVKEKIEYIESGKFDKWIEEGSPMNFGFVFPIVVFEGSMYSAVFPLNKETLNESNLINYATQYNSGIYDLHYDIDIIKKEYFIRYLEMLNQDITAIEREFTAKDHIKENISKKIGEKIHTGRLFF